MERRLTFASLFSGIGMADLAARWCGWDHAFWCEIDPFCQRVMRYHFNKSKEYDDITETYFGGWEGKIDVLHGSSPCQAVSLAGKRRGDTDDRWLWSHMLRAIREIRPAWVSFENVANLKTVVSSFPEAYVEGGAGEAWGHGSFHRGLLIGIIEDLEKEGYSVQSYIIPACAVGAPHRRERIWIVGRRDDAAYAFDPGLQEEGTEQRATWTSGDGSRRAATDAYGDRRWRGEDKQVTYAWGQGEADDSGRGEDGIAAYADRLGSDKIRHDVQAGEPDGNRIDGYGGERYAPDTYGEELEGVRDGHEERETCFEEQGQTDGGSGEDGDELPYDRWWGSFPTQSPILRGDDGYPFGLAGCSIPVNKWRKEAIKAIGNALLPQVIYEIYRAIDKCERHFS